ncbi:MAG: response regulator transcription factor [Pseudomonadota bacterium]
MDIPISNGPITLTIADDHEVVRRGLIAFIEMAEDIDLVAVAEDGAGAVDAARAHAPDVLLLDLLMPDRPAPETISAAKRASPQTQIIVLTSHEGVEQLAPAQAAGAISYVLKDTAPEELINVIRRAHAGEATIAPRLTASPTTSRREAPAPEAPPIGGLTHREIEVLRAIADGRSNKRIAHDLEITERTVKHHVSNILSKLHLTDRTQAAVYAWREGLAERD